MPDIASPSISIPARTAFFCTVSFYLLTLLTHPGTVSQTVRTFVDISNGLATSMQPTAPDLFHVYNASCLSSAFIGITWRVLDRSSYPQTSLTVFRVTSQTHDLQHLCHLPLTADYRPLNPACTTQPVPTPADQQPLSRLSVYSCQQAAPSLQPDASFACIKSFTCNININFPISDIRFAYRSRLQRVQQRVQNPNNSAQNLCIVQKPNHW